MPTYYEVPVRQAKRNLNTLCEQLLVDLELRSSVTLKWALNLGGGKGTSNWLTTVPLADQEFVLNRNELTDAHNLRYYIEMRGLPLKCPCRKNSNVTHASNCRTGEFIHIRHDGLGDCNAKLLTKVQTDVEIEPALIPINNPTPLLTLMEIILRME